MPLSVQSVEDVVNLALVRIGYKQRIGSIMDGSLASKAALDIYSQTRDAALREYEWGFAERNIGMTQLKAAPPGGYNPAQPWTSAFPILPFKFEYAYPSDCLKVRAIRPVPVFLPVFDPQPVNFRIADDNSLATPAKVILCNVDLPVTLVYTAQVTNPMLWESDFIEALAAQLGRRLAPVLVNPEIVKMAAQDEAVETGMAETKLG